MNDDIMMDIADDARRLLKQIDLEEGFSISVMTRTYGDPDVWYESRGQDFYEIVEERGHKRERQVANSIAEMRVFFIHKAIHRYACSLELAKRRPFESPLRQIDEIKSECYEAIGMVWRVQDSYQDNNHIILDLIKAYKEIAKEMLRDKKYVFMKRRSRKYLKYIANRRYASPVGGIFDVNITLSLLRDLLMNHLPKRSRGYEKLMLLEKYYDQTTLSVHIMLGGTDFKFGIGRFDLNSKVRYFEASKAHLYVVTSKMMLFDKLGQCKMLKEPLLSMVDLKDHLDMNDLEEAYHRYLKNRDIKVNTTVKRYICIRLIIEIYNTQNSKRHMDILLEFIRTYGIFEYEETLYRMVVLNYYGVFESNGPSQMAYIDIFEQMNMFLNLK